MARKKNTEVKPNKKTKNIEDEEVKLTDSDVEAEPSPDEIAEQEGGDDVVGYTMGDIITMENDKEEKLDLKKLNPDEEEDIEWIDPEYSLEDKDPWQEQEDRYDGDNPYDDDDSDY